MKLTPSIWPKLLAVAVGLLLGDRSGSIMSYWFIPEIMRLELSWLDYAEKIPQLLRYDFPPGSRMTILNARFIGAVLGATTAFILYYLYEKRKKHV
ncbi:MAG: hypothetical protein Q4A74_07090 [Cardiobacteriaceae bacterium]|nr:hypothetical protein [Cardiobacteriaceae bacterium]